MAGSGLKSSQRALRPITMIGGDLFRDALPDEQRLHHRLGEFGSIHPQSHSVRTLK